MPGMSSREAKANLNGGDQQNAAQTKQESGPIAHPHSKFSYAAEPSGYQSHHGFTDTSSSELYRNSTGKKFKWPNPFPATHCLLLKTANSLG